MSKQSSSLLILSLGLLLTAAVVGFSFQYLYVTPDLKVIPIVSSDNAINHTLPTIIAESKNDSKQYAGDSKE